MREDIVKRLIHRDTCVIVAPFKPEVDQMLFIETSDVMIVDSDSVRRRTDQIKDMVK